eukprot:4179043-Pyramimonas_sp.AAC.1
MILLFLVPNPHAPPGAGRRVLPAMIPVSPADDLTVPDKPIFNTVLYRNTKHLSGYSSASTLAPLGHVR